MTRQRSVGRALWLALLASVFAHSGCFDPPPALELESEAPVSVLDDVQWGEAVRRARTRLYERLGRRRLTTGIRRELVPPVGGSEAGIALSHWLLRLEGALVPQEPTTPLASVASAQQYVRERRDDSLEVWMIDVITPLPSLRFEIVVVQPRRTVRSGEHSIFFDGPLRLWPFEAEFALAKGEVVGARELLGIGGRDYALGPGGPWELRLEGGRIESRRRSVGLRSQAARGPLPPMERVDGDIGLRFRAAIDSAGRSLRRMELRRGMHAWSVDLQAGDAAPMRALAARVSKDPYDWILLRDDGTVEIHRRPLRMVTPTRATQLLEQPQPNRDVRIRSVQASSVRDPLSIWSKLAGREPIPPGEIQASSKHAELRAECSAIAEGWEASLKERLTADAAELSWLLGPLRGIELDRDDERLRLKGDGLPPDLAFRLSHPALWPASPALAECHYRQRRPTTLWVDGNEFDAAWTWPARIGEGSAPEDGDGVTVAIVPSAAADASATARLATLLSGVDLPQLFAVDAPAWAKRFPATNRAWSEFVASSSSPEGRTWELVLFVDQSILDSTERRRLLERLRVLLQPEGFLLRSHGLGDTDITIPPRAVVASLLRVGLFTDDPFLRALELRSWTTLEAPDDPLRQAQNWAPDDERRLQLARQLESDLLRHGRIIPLWRERWQAQLDPRLEMLSESRGCVPPSLSSLRWRPAAVGLSR